MDDYENLIFQAAKLHYDYGLSKLQVAEKLGISPSTVTRLIKKALELGVVNISVPSPKDFTNNEKDVAKHLRKKLGIEVLIVPNSSQYNATQNAMGIRLEEWLRENISDGLSIGLSGGRCIRNAIPLIRKPLSSLNIVQLMGGVSSTDESAQADFIARGFADKFRCKCHVLHCPAILQDASGYNGLVNSPIVTSSTEYYDHLDIAVIGVGSFSKENPILSLAGLSESDMRRLKKLGCVGEVCCRFFDADGKECESSLSKRVIGVNIDQLIKTPKVCAVTSSPIKAAAIIASSRSGIIKTVITDNETAEAVADMLR